MSDVPQPRRRTVLVTGSAGGIGRAALELFAENGWRVIGVDRALFGDGFPQDGHFIQADIARPEEMQTIFAEVHRYCDRLDALVNNAAIQIAKPIVDTSIAEWDEVMASNLRSVFIGVKLAYPLLKAAEVERSCECFICACRSNLGQYRLLCCQ